MCTRDLVAMREVGAARVARVARVAMREVAAKEEAGAAKGVVLGATMAARGAEVTVEVVAGAEQPLGAAVTFVVQGEAPLQWRRRDCKCHNLHHHSSTPPSCTGCCSSRQRARPRGR